MTYEDGSFNGRSDPKLKGTGPKRRPVVHVPSRAASVDDMDARLARIMYEAVQRHKERHRERYGPWR